MYAHLLLQRVSSNRESMYVIDLKRLQMIGKPRPISLRGSAVSVRCNDFVDGLSRAFPRSWKRRVTLWRARARANRIKLIDRKRRKETMHCVCSRYCIIRGTGSYVAALLSENYVNMQSNGLGECNRSPYDLKSFLQECVNMTVSL